MKREFLDLPLRSIEFSALRTGSVD